MGVDVGGRKMGFEFPECVWDHQYQMACKYVTGTVVLHRMPVGQVGRVASGTVAVSDSKLYAAMAFGKL